jgi:hypothetical protein
VTSDCGTMDVSGRSRWYDKDACQPRGRKLKRRQQRQSTASSTPTDGCHGNWEEVAGTLVLTHPKHPIILFYHDDRDKTIQKISSDVQRNARRCGNSIRIPPRRGEASGELSCGTGLKDGNMAPPQYELNL